VRSEGSEDKRSAVPMQTGAGTEAVSKFVRTPKSCHDLGRHLSCFPHPPPSPSGRGCQLEPFCSALSLWERDRVRAFVPRCRTFHEF
jgi:hypothetical protein